MKGCDLSIAGEISLFYVVATSTVRVIEFLGKYFLSRATKQLAPCMGAGSSIWRYDSYMHVFEKYIFIFIKQMTLDF